MTTPWEVAVAQADVAGHLILHTRAPLAGSTVVHGVLPAPGGAPAVRVTVGRTREDGSGTPGRGGGPLAVYEVPLFDGDEVVGPWETAARVRHAAGRPAAPGGGPAQAVLGAPLVWLPHEAPGGELPEDRAYALLTALNCPPPGYEEREAAESLLVGFRHLDGGRMRLYVRDRVDTGVVACDVRLDEAGPAVIAEVFPRSRERELHEPPGDDPHCTAVVDLTH